MVSDGQKIRGPTVLSPRVPIARHPVGKRHESRVVQLLEQPNNGRKVKLRAKVSLFIFLLCLFVTGVTLCEIIF